MIADRPLEWARIIRERRADLSVSSAVVAGELGTSRQCVSNFENGQSTDTTQLRLSCETDRSARPQRRARKRHGITMAAEHLGAYLHGHRVGSFDRINGSVSFTFTFTFDEDWPLRNTRLQLSASLPKTSRQHIGAAPENFLWGLLPDNSSVLSRWGRRFGVNPNNALALLAA